MSKIKVILNEGDVEIEGNVESIIEFVLGYMEKQIKELDEKEENNNTNQDTSIITVPTIKQIIAFIVTQPNYKHTFPMIIEHFIGGDIKLKRRDKRYERFRTRVNQAREKIKKKVSGHWEYKKDVTNGDARVTQWRFLKD